MDKASLQILIVDDDERSVRSLKNSLRAAGFGVHSTSTGGRALMRCESRPPDLLVVDMALPDMDGYELCERLRCDPFLVDLPVIMFTRGDDELARNYAAEMTAFAGGDFFLAKPVDTSVVLRLVQELTRDPVRPFDRRRQRFPTQVVWPTGRPVGIAAVG